jgi:signal recognition particle receptor subunit beta
MPAVQPDQKTVTFKIVYCGTPLSGKTTNLRTIHSRLDPAGRGDLVALSTHRDRTLFFDFLALETAAIPGYQISFHLYTVPGQIVYNATMQLVLHQADGVVFVADSQLDRQRENLQAMQNLEANLRLNGRSIDSIPLVLQYNKRDLTNLAPVEYMEFLLNQRAQRCPSFSADASRGRNVLATLNAISTAVLQRFHSRTLQQSPDPSPPPAPSRPAAVAAVAG